MRGIPLGVSDAVVSEESRRGVLGALAAAAGDIKLAHSVFALPFAVLAAALAHRGAARSLAGPMALVAACMIAARTFAMLVNRLADASFDARNPRTRGRALPQGRLSRGAAGAMIAGSGALFVVAACGFGWTRGNWYPALLAGPVLAWLAFYSFTKRFTALCHAVLGVSLALAPLAAALAVDPGALSRTPAIVLLGGFVLCWVAGFDVLYARADIEFDRASGLKSLPALLGERGARRASLALHALAGLLLLGAWALEPRLGALTALGVAAALGLLTLQHARKDAGDTASQARVMLLNGIAGLVLGVAGTIDALARS